MNKEIYYLNTMISSCDTLLELLSEDERKNKAEIVIVSAKSQKCKSRLKELLEENKN